MSLRLWYNGGNNYIMSLSTQTWYYLKFVVTPSTTNYKLYVNDVLKHTTTSGSGFDQADATNYVYCGDDETSSNYGKAYFDWMRVEQGGSYYLLENCNDQILDSWGIFTSGSGSIAISGAQGADDEGDYSLYISSPQASDKAWLYSPTITWNTSYFYDIHMDIYLPTDSNHWFYVAYNGHVCCVIDQYRNLTLREWNPHNNRYENHIMLELTTGTWHTIRINVQPMNNLIQFSADGYYWGSTHMLSQTATSNIYIGDDETNNNYGSMYFDEIRLDTCLS